MGASIADVQDGGLHQLKQAVHRNGPASASGLLERFFTFVFSGLVYPQVWEDPEVDMAAMELDRSHRMVAIASGGCNVLSYLSARPGSILAVDFNPAHIALTRLKLTAARHLGGYDAFRRFFAEADSPANPVVYDRFIRPRLDDFSRRYWEGRGPTGRRRIEMFARRFYRHGASGRFIGAMHLLARLYGIKPSDVLAAASQDEQERLFESRLAPLFERRPVRWLAGRKASLFWLGIPPAQYEKLAESRTMADILSERLRKLVCEFPLSDNYFAWQALARRYDRGEGAALPPYLRRENFQAVRDGAENVEAVFGSLTTTLSNEPPESIDRYVLLDAQDWMNDADLNALWAEITRTARPGARVVFRTTGSETILPGRLSADLLGHWDYEEARSRELGRCDRSAVYGGFHLYCRREAR